MDGRLTKGGNIPWPHRRAALTVAGLSEGASVLAFLVTAAGKVRTDDDFVFFNNPAVPGVAVLGQTAELDLDLVPDDVDRIVVAVVADDADPEPLSSRALEVGVEPDGLRVEVTGLTTERAVVLVEVYRRATAWKLRNVSAGWTEGFAALVRTHGVQVDDDGAAPETEPTTTAPDTPAIIRTPAGAPDPRSPTAEPAAPAISPPTVAAIGPTINLRKPGIDAIDLGKRTGAINLRKGQQVTITKSFRIVATCTWPRTTDYDIYALVRYRDGHCETVATFGTQGNERNFQLTTRDGAVRHSGDVGRAQSKGWRRKQATPDVGLETVEITLNSEILAVVPVVYSAQSNGGGSFRRYQVSMAIDNGSGDTVTIDAGDASDDEDIYTCVPGIIINDPDGVRIQFLELYSAVGSEQRPEVGGDLIVAMDAGPVNAFK